MSKYYYLVSELPNIALDDSKLAYSVCKSQTEIEDILFSKGKRLTDLFYLKYGSMNLLAHAKRLDSDPDQRGGITHNELNTLYKALKDEKKILKDDNLPPYFVDFFKLYLAEEAKNTENEKEYISWEDRLAALYYEYTMKYGNKFVVDRSEFSLNINNVLAAVTRHKYGFDKANYIVGHNKIAENIHTSNTCDLNLGGPAEYSPELQRIAEETNLIVCEKKIDLLKRKWLDSNTFFKTFDIEGVFAYLLKLGMTERWVILDKVKGEKTFRELVGATKTGSKNALEEFKRNNIK